MGAGGMGRYSGLSIVPPKKICPLEPMKMTLFGESVFANVIKLGISR